MWGGDGKKTLSYYWTPGGVSQGPSYFLIFLTPPPWKPEYGQFRAPSQFEGSDFYSFSGRAFDGKANGF